MMIIFSKKEKKKNDGHVSIVDCATTHTILRDKISCNLTLTSVGVMTNPSKAKRGGGGGGGGVGKCLL